MPNWMTTNVTLTVTINHTHRGQVGVGDLGVDTIVVLDVLEGEVHESSITAVVAPLLWAVYEILLTQRDEFASLAEMLSFKCSGLCKQAQQDVTILIKTKVKFPQLR